MPALTNNGQELRGKKKNRSRSINQYVVRFDTIRMVWYDTMRFVWYDTIHTLLLMYVHTLPYDVR